MDAGFFLDDLTQRVTDLNLVPESFEEQRILGHLLEMIRDGGLLRISTEGRSSLYRFRKSSTRPVDCGE